MIVVTESITPTELMEMDKDKLMAIVTHHGSDMSHAAIMAKTMNIRLCWKLTQIRSGTDGRLLWTDIPELCILIRMKR